MSDYVFISEITDATLDINALPIYADYALHYRM